MVVLDNPSGVSLEDQVDLANACLASKAVQDVADTAASWLRGREPRKQRSMVDPAWQLICLRRFQAKAPINLSCLCIGSAYVVHMPGELFVEYQLAAQRMRPQDFVCMAAYGDYSPGYIGTKIAYSQGGYEVGMRSRVAPEVEDVLFPAIRELLEVTQ